MVDESSAQGVAGAQADDDKNYDVSFFKPTSPHAKANMELIVVMVLIWAVAVFGFQFALLVLEKPTPEQTKVDFDKVWPSVMDGSATVEAKQELGRSILSVLGKGFTVKADHKKILSEALTCTVVDLMGPAKGKAFVAALGAEGANTVALAEQAVPAIGLKAEGFDKIRAQWLPFGLVKVNGPVLSESVKQALPGIMERYLVHNQSVLTDTRFLGFPFHYWYTAQFLLILFVVLCLVYAKQIEAIHKRHGFVED